MARGGIKTSRMFFNVQEANFSQESEAICIVHLKNGCMSRLCFNFKTCVLRPLNRSGVMICNNRIHPHPPILMLGTREKISGITENFRMLPNVRVLLEG